MTYTQVYTVFLRILNSVYEKLLASSFGRHILNTKYIFLAVEAHGPILFRTGEVGAPFPLVLTTVKQTVPVLKSTPAAHKAA